MHLIIHIDSASKFTLTNRMILFDYRFIWFWDVHQQHSHAHFFSNQTSTICSIENVGHRFSLCFQAIYFVALFKLFVNFLPPIFFFFFFGLLFPFLFFLSKFYFENSANTWISFLIAWFHLYLHKDDLSFAWITLPK